MANQLGMDKVQAIFALHEVGWSNRRIARELGIHRTTVAGYLDGRGDSRPTGPPFGRCPPTGSEREPDEANECSRSLCEPYRETILQKLGQGLSAQRIFQDLQEEYGFGHSYVSVKRYVRQLRGSRTLPFRRMECAPGEEAQVDFGTGVPLKGPDGKRKVHRDGHVSVQKAYYSVPPEYVTRRVWVRWDSRLVRIFDHKMQQRPPLTRRCPPAHQARAGTL